MTDHRAVRDSLELATALPHGIAESTAEEAPSRAEVAAHLASCPSCAAEAARLARMSAGLREVLRVVPAGADALGSLAGPAMPLPDDLRERTLSFVREVGRARGATTSASASASAIASATASAPAYAPVESAAAAAPRSRPSSVVPWPTRARREVGRNTFAWTLAAAALVIGIIGGSVVVGGQDAGSLQAEKDRSIALAAFNVATVNLEKQPDVRRIVLAGAGQPAVNGMLLYSPATGDMVVGVLGLAQPAPGRLVTCWLVAANGTRTQLGTMRFDGSLASWSGWSAGVSATRPGDRFEVSLVDSGGTPGPAILVGSVPAS